MNDNPKIESKSNAGNEVVINIEHLKITLGGNEILKDVNLKVFRGETVIILGKSGSGKSVTLKCIIGLMKPDEGKVVVLKENVPELEIDELQVFRTKLGFIFQSGALYDSMSVRENLEFPLVRHEDLSAEEIETQNSDNTC